MDEKLYDQFRCPICFEIPEDQIFQCKNGHTICNQCSETLSTCPQCRVTLETPKIRCRVLENLLDTLKFNCEHKDLGCTITLSRGEISKHAQNCVFAGYTLKLCQQLGLSCGFTINSKFLQKAIDHFRTCHDFILCKNSELLIHLETIPDTLSTKNSMWTPVIVDMLKEEKKLVFILSNINGYTGTLSIACLEIKEDVSKEKDVQMKVHFSIEANDKLKKPNIEWSVTAVEAKHIESILDEPVCGFPLAVLKKYYTTDDAVVLKCSVRKFDPSLEPSSSNPESVHTLPLIPNRMCRKGGTNSTSQEASGMYQELYYIYEGFDCVGCNTNPITGVRYVSLERRLCNNLCRLCFDKGELVKDIKCIIQNLEQHNNFNRLSMLSNMKFQSRGSIRIQIDTSGINENQRRCGNCSNTKRYVCLVCTTVTGYCHDCFPAQNHPSDHFFAVTETNAKLNLVIAKIIENEYDTIEVISSF